MGCAPLRDQSLCVGLVSSVALERVVDYSTSQGRQSLITHVVARTPSVAVAVACAGEFVLVPYLYEYSGTLSNEYHKYKQKQSLHTHYHSILRPFCLFCCCTV